MCENHLQTTAASLSRRPDTRTGFDEETCGCNQQNRRFLPRKTETQLVSTNKTLFYNYGDEPRMRTEQLTDIKHVDHVACEMRSTRLLTHTVLKCCRCPHKHCVFHWSKQAYPWSMQGIWCNRSFPVLEWKIGHEHWELPHQFPWYIPRNRSLDVFGSCGALGSPENSPIEIGYSATSMKRLYPTTTYFNLYI